MLATLRTAAERNADAVEQVEMLIKAVGFARIPRWGPLLLDEDRQALLDDLREIVFALKG